MDEWGADWSPGNLGPGRDWSPVVVDWSPVPSRASSTASSPRSSPGGVTPWRHSSFPRTSPGGDSLCPEMSPCATNTLANSLDVSPQDRSFLSSVSLEELPERRLTAHAESRSTSPGSDTGILVAEGASWRHFDVDKERRIGVGSYAEVVKVYQPSAERWFALKRSRGGSARARRHLRREIANFARLRRETGSEVPGLVRMYSAWEEGGRVCLQLELCHGSAGDLAKRLGPMAEDEGLSFLSQVLTPLGHLHALGLSHLDLKPDNVLFKLQGPAGRDQNDLDDPLAPYGGDDASWSALVAAGRFKLADLSLLSYGDDSGAALLWGSSTVAAGCFIPVELVRAAAVADEVLRPSPVKVRRRASRDYPPDLRANEPRAPIDPRACDVYGAGACALYMTSATAPVRDDITDEVDLDRLLVSPQFRALLRDLLSPEPIARGSASAALERVALLWGGRPPQSCPPSPAATPPAARSPSPHRYGDSTSTPKRRSLGREHREYLDRSSPPKRLPRCLDMCMKST